MEIDYILGPNGELYHSGIKGMRWGIRRYQNPDGSLTPAGRKRYNKEMEKLKSREKKIKAQERVKARQAKLDSKKAELDEREKALKGESDDVAKVKAKSSESSKPKSISEMSDEELRNKVMRLQNERLALDLERQIAAMTPKQVSKGEKFLKTISDVAVPAATQASKKLMTEWLEKKGAEALGLKNTDELGVLKKEVEKLNLQKQKKEYTDFINGKKKPTDEYAETAKKAAYLKNRLDILEREAKLNEMNKATQDAAEAKKKAARDTEETKKKAKQDAEEAERQAARDRVKADREEKLNKAIERDIEQRMQNIDDKNAKEKAKREAPLEGEVIDNHKKTKTESTSTKKDPIIIDMDDYINSDSVTSLVPYGRSYVQYLLEED